jgi:hypothetical protein
VEIAISLFKRVIDFCLFNFNPTKVNYTSRTVEVGAGLTWGQVYAALQPTGVNVVGGRAAVVGVAGLTLGRGEYLPPSHSPGFIYFQVIRIKQVSMDLQLTASLDMSSYFQMELSKM